MNSSEFAQVAFWDLDKENNQMVCKRFFIIPNPMKRMIVDKQKTRLYHILYVSEHTKDVFFFFKGYKVDLEAEDIFSYDKTNYVMQVAFINLDETSNSVELEQQRHMVNHCHKFSEIRQDSVLDKFLQQIDETDYN